MSSIRQQSLWLASVLCGCLIVAAPVSRAQPTPMPVMPMPVAAPDASVKIADPTSVVMIVNRDSNDISFMDIKTKKIVGRTFLGKNVNPHMVMMSPDGRYLVTGGTSSNTAYIIDTRTL